MSGPKLRIALFTHSVNPRGGVVHTVELAAALHRRGCDVTIFAPASDREAMFRGSPCPVVLARIADAPRDMVAMVRARIDALKHALSACAADAFDVLHAQDSISGNALAELKAAGAIRGFVRTVHHLDRFAEPQLARWQQRAWQDADTLLCVSDGWTRAMRDEHGVDAWTVPNGVDTERYRSAPHGDDVHAADCALRERLGIGAGGPVILAVGGIEARKNTLRLLEAFALLRARPTAAQLVIAGGASLLDHDRHTRRFIERMGELGVASGPFEPVVLTGPLDDAAMPGLFRIADVVAMVSLREGFGLVVLEALASGKPVVVSQRAPFDEYLDERTCCWAQPDDPESIAAALRRALADRGGIDFEQAVPALLRRFSWDSSASRHLELYRQHVARVPHAPRAPRATGTTAETLLTESTPCP
ncbi:MSMEG_0565 family glycosyltransferase [Paraburkholderia phosphatilytica]|uniref:MSMEG_0565 family glycosyltransferase n=1 Tax=Paraburkholderia phosphatilytica TaxID=2282883 RepID=UPI000E4EAFA1|nr:MSMEG_0565 family glycosyltransferase [Paraburkholderia phosphatilytica]